MNLVSHCLNILVSSCNADWWFHGISSKLLPSQTLPCEQILRRKVCVLIAFDIIFIVFPIFSYFSLFFYMQPLQSLTFICKKNLSGHTSIDFLFYFRAQLGKKHHLSILLKEIYHYATGCRKSPGSE